MSPCPRAVLSTPPLQATDVRWDVICATVDDRTPGERGEAACKEGEVPIPKSRYSSISAYIAPYKPAGCGGAAAAAAGGGGGDDLGMDDLGMDDLGEPEPCCEPEPESRARAMSIEDGACCALTCRPTAREACGVSLESARIGVSLLAWAPGLGPGFAGCSEGVWREPVPCLWRQTSPIQTNPAVLCAR